MDIYMVHEFGFEKQNMGIYHVEICWNTRWDRICNQQYGHGLRPMVAIFWGTTIHYQAFDPKDNLTTKHVKFHGEDLAYLVIKYKLMKKRNNDKKPIRLYHPNNCLQIVP